MTDKIAKLRAKRFSRFGLSRKMIDKTNHPRVIQRALHCSSANVVMCFERYSDEIKFYDYGFKVAHSEKVTLKKSGFVTAIAFDDKSKLFGVTTTDC